MRPLFALLVAFIALSLLPAPAHAAPPSLAPALSAPAPSTPVEEAPDSPRVSVRRYQNLCARGAYADAAKYLDLSNVPPHRGPELARRLDVVLRHKLWVDPELLSGAAEGRAEARVPKGVEELGRIVDSKGRSVAVRIVRHVPANADEDGRWIFSHQTVLHVDDWYSEVDAQWLHARLPAVLLRTGPKALLYWQWLALPFLALVAYLFARAAAWGSGWLVRRLLERVTWAGGALDKLHGPARMAWSLVVFYALVPHLHLYLRAAELVGRMLSALAYLCFFWGLVRLVAVFGESIANAGWAQGRPSASSVVTLLMRIGKLLIVAIGIIVALSQLGYPVTSVIAGLGIGGIALALAAQKTVENLFGSVSIVVDRPFAVGEWVNIEGHEGTVESIGLRSTRVRTLDRTLLIYPNGKLADLRIEAFGSRDTMRFGTMVALQKDTPPAVLADVVSRARRALLAHDKTLEEGMRAWVHSIGESSIDLELAVYVAAGGIADFGPVRHELVLAVLGAVTAAGAKLAVPAREMRGEGAVAGATEILDAGSAPTPTS